MHFSCYRFILFFLFVLGIGALPSEGVVAGEFSAQVDTRKIEEGGEIVLTLTAKGSPEDDFELPALESFDVEQSAHSSSHSWINGKSESKEIYSFTLSPKHTGTLTIPEFSLKIDGKVQTTKPINIEVSAVGQNQSAQAGAADQEREFFIEREFSRKVFYVGELISVKIKLFTKFDILEGKAGHNLPDDFKVTEQEGNKKYEQNVDGINYTVYEVNYLVEAEKSGNFDLPPARMDLVALMPQQRTREPRQFDPFQFFGGGSMGRQKVKKRLLSSRENITVKSVPLKDAPADYIPIIGQFSLTGGLKSHSIEVQKTALLTLNVEGWGKLEGILIPQITKLENVKVYPDKPSYDSSIEDGGVFSKSQFQYSLVPLSPGTVHLGEYSFSYFNTLTENFERLKLDLGDLSVTGSINDNSTRLTAGSSGAREPSAATDSRSKTMFFNYEEDQILADQRFDKRYASISLAVLGVWGFLLLVWAIYPKVRLWWQPKKDTSFDFQQAQKLWQKNIQLYNEARLGGYPEGEILSLINGFKNLVSCRFCIPPGMLTSRDVESYLHKVALPEAKKKDLVSLFGEIESCQYSSAHLGSAQVTQVLEKMQHLAKELGASK